MSLEGQTLGEFEILSRIGQGGMGAVYKARQISLKRLVALKTLQASLASDAEFIARFQREAIAAASLNHPNLVQVHSAGETDGLHWFAMEFIEGESAKTRLTRKGRLDLAEAVAIAIHVVTALEYGWRKANLIHRDIKPDNIFLSEDGEVKLGDLGLAKSVGGATAEVQSLTMTGSSMGTPHYISPEQGQGKKDVDFRADIYSLGCTLYHLAGGTPPYSGDTALAVMMQHVTAPVPNLALALPGCPQSLAVAVMKMMAKNPAHRQQSYAEILADLRRAYDEVAGATLPSVVAVTQPQGRAASPKPPANPRPANQGAFGESALPQAQPAPADIHSAPTIIAQPAAVSSGQPASGALKTKGRLYAVIAVVAAILGIAAFFALRKKEPQLTEAERAAKEGGTRAPSRVSSAAGDGSVRGAPAPPAAATKDTPFVNSLGMKFVPVPIIGGPTDKQRVLFSVWETRVRDYEEFATETKRNWEKPDFEQGPDHPATTVSWTDATAFCAWLTDRERRDGRIQAGEVYRLPSDHEWSCAAGIGAQENAGDLPSDKAKQNRGVLPWGDAWPPPDRTGNFWSEELRPLLEGGQFDRLQIYLKGSLSGYRDGHATTAPVGSFPANAFGLHDLFGNAWEFCQDWIDASQTSRVMRGGCWNTDLRDRLSLSYRSTVLPNDRTDRGFRVVLASVSPSPTLPVSQSSAARATKDAPFVNTLGMKFVPVPITGGPTNGQRVLFSIWETRVQDYAAFSEETKRKVTTDRYSLEVVNGKAEMKQAGRSWLNPGFEQGRDHPVVAVSWDDAVAFCQWLTVKESRDGKLPPDMAYRLPTDLEWSCAVNPGEPQGDRGFLWGGAWPPPAKSANYAGTETAADLPPGWPVIAGYDDGFPRTSPVGAFPANALGIYDLAGNVREWCGDLGKDSRDYKIMRGASWQDSGTTWLQSATRWKFSPWVADTSEGFRIVLTSIERTAAASPVSDATKDAPFVNSLGMKFVPVPGTKVLFSVWDTRVMDYEQYAAAKPGVDGAWKTQQKDGVPVGREPDHPVVGVSWEDAQAFCQWLTEKERKEPGRPRPAAPSRGEGAPMRRGARAPRLLGSIACPPTPSGAPPSACRPSKARRRRRRTGRTLWTSRGVTSGHRRRRWATTQTNYSTQSSR